MPNLRDPSKPANRSRHFPVPPAPLKKLSTKHAEASIGRAAEELWDLAYETDQVTAPMNSLVARFSASQRASR